MSNDRSSFLLPLLAGLAAGAVLGVLFAPQSGRKTRKAVRKKVNDLRAQAGEAVANGRAAMDAARIKLSDIKQSKRDDLDEVVRLMMEEGEYLWDRVTEPASSPGKATT